MNKNKEYDLIVSLGEACPCTEMLRYKKLQVFSYPFDWLFGSDFDGRINILISEFERFIDKNDLEFKFYNKDNGCNAYYNKYNTITYNHDFFANLPFDTSYKLVKDKYERRIKRLLENIDKAQSVLFVYIETPISNHKKPIKEEIIRSFSKISSKYANKKINLLYVHNSKELENTDLTSDIKYISTYYKKEADNDYTVSPEDLIQVLDGYSLKLSLNMKIKNLLHKIFSIKNTGKKRTLNLLGIKITLNKSQ